MVTRSSQTDRSTDVVCFRDCVRAAFVKTFRWHDDAMTVRSGRSGGARLFMRVLLVIALFGAGLWARGVPPMSVAPDLAAWWPWEATTTVTAYFRDGPFFFPVPRRMPINDGLPRAALHALLAGPSPESGLTNPIPPGVEIRSIELAGGVARIDLSAAFLSEGNDLEAAQTALVHTMTSLPGVTSVALSVEGKSLATFTRKPLM